MSSVTKVTSLGATPQPAAAPSITSKRYADSLVQAIGSLPHAAIEELFEALAYARDNRRTIFTMGNGGSGATASHWVVDMNKGCNAPGAPAFRMQCLNDNIPSLMAQANDASYDEIFVAPLRNFLEVGDVVIAISGSGNSRNVLRAVEHANETGALTVGLTGFDGGELRRKARIAVHVPVRDMQLVEDLHLSVVHMCLKRFGKF